MKIQEDVDLLQDLYGKKMGLVQDDYYAQLMLAGQLLYMLAYVCMKSCKAGMGFQSHADGKLAVKVTAVDRGVMDVVKPVPPLGEIFFQATPQTGFTAAGITGNDVDLAVLSDKRSSELGRFAVTTGFDGLGAFKTPTLRNVAVTAPYMHDGGKATLRDVIVHYNNGGVTNEGDPVNDFLSSGIRPLDLTEDEIDDLVAFMDALTSPEYADLPKALGLEEK